MKCLHSWGDLDVPVGCFDDEVVLVEECHWALDGIDRCFDEAVNGHHSDCVAETGLVDCIQMTCHQYDYHKNC